MGEDPYCYPGTNTLVNRFNIREEEELKATEARVAAVALFALEDEPLQDPMNEARIMLTHRMIFSEIYAWAGNYRVGVGRMTKGRLLGYSVTYGACAFVPGEMTRIFEELRRENFLRGLDEEQFASRLAYFYSELDSTHPFREGNSRTLRQLCCGRMSVPPRRIESVESASLTGFCCGMQQASMRLRMWP